MYLSIPAGRLQFSGTSSMGSCGTGAISTSPANIATSTCATDSEAETIQPGLVPPSQAVSQTGNPWKPNVAERDWKWIVIHHTATDKGSVESIHETHLKRRDKNGNPWLSGIGYHFVIGNGQGMEDGDIEPTFR
ncbi:MAG: hypothetical protein R3C11_08100 [Planctomycetaceae bacterium]